MKTIPVKELLTNVDTVLNCSQRERIVIRRAGKPCAILVGIQDYDAADLQLAASADFWLMIGQRRAQGRSISLSEVEASLKTRRPQSARSRPTRKRRRAE
jgi:antitoxin (DNA-binding transcriptional repressor) of toxin-antitoxin stability system